MIAKSEKTAKDARERQGRRDR